MTVSTDTSSEVRDFGAKSEEAFSSRDESPCNQSGISFALVVSFFSCGRFALSVEMSGVVMVSLCHSSEVGIETDAAVVSCNQSG